MKFEEIQFLAEGKGAIENHYRRWFSTDNDYQYKSGNIELHYRSNIYNLPNGNSRRWDYILIKLQDKHLVRVVFAEPHPIKEGNVSEMLEKLDWLKYMLKHDPLLQYFDGHSKEFYWIYSNSKISKNSQARRKCDKMGLRITGIPLAI